MNTATLEQVLAATGYLPDGQPAPGLRLGAEAQSSRHARRFCSGRIVAQRVVVDRLLQV
ncbi:hypothetical protein WJ970_08775 [Achromobacter xylosoxidans]